MKKFLTIPLAALALAACSDLSTAPLAEEAAEVPTGINASASASFSSSIGSTVAGDVTATLEDVRDRLAPLLTDASAKDKLRGYIAEINTSLAAGNAEEAQRVLTLARGVADPNAGIGDVAVVNVIALLLENIDNTVQ